MLRRYNSALVVLLVHVFLSFAQPDMLNGEGLKAIPPIGGETDWGREVVFGRLNQ